MKSATLVITIFICISAYGKVNFRGATNNYPLIKFSYNPIFFLSDYSTDINNNINASTFNGEVYITDFDPSVEETLGDNSMDVFGGNEFKLGIILNKWFELGFGYSWYGTGTSLNMNTYLLQDYTFSDGGTHQATKNLRVEYGVKFRSYSGYLKFSVPLYEHKDDLFHLNLNPQYGFAINSAANATTDYGVEYPVFPDSYDATYSNGEYSDPPVDWEYVIEMEPPGEILNSKTNLLSLGLSVDFLQYFSVYADFCYYASFNKDKLYIEHYFFDDVTSVLSGFKFPGTITSMPTLKTGIAFIFPLNF